MPASQLLEATRVFTNAEIKAFPSSGALNVVPAPGVGKRLVFLLGFVRGDFGAEGYTNTDPDAGELRFVNGSTTISSVIINTTDVANLTVFLGPDPPIKEATLIPRHVPNETYGALLGPANQTSAENIAINFVIDNGFGDFLGGNAANTLRVTVFYIVIDV